jgi:hypothetical protein
MSTYHVAAIKLANKDVLGTPVHVDSKTVGPLVVRMSGRSSLVQGTVRTAGGPTASDAYVILVPSDALREDTTAYKVVNADGQGRFSIPGIRPGMYRLLAIDELPHDNSWFDPGYLNAYLTSAISLDLSQQQTITVDLIAKH